MTPRLREGIDAAKRGDKTTARRLLQQVLSSDGDNELALMWMASVVEPLDERRFYLERALRVNPNNSRASEALRRLGGPEPVNTTPRLRTSPTNRADARRAATPAPNTNLFLIAAAVVAFVVIAVIVASAVSSLSPVATPTIVAAQVIEQTRAAFLVQSQTPTRVRVQPTATVLAGIVVTLDAALLTPLPPTFTPTATPQPSETPEPTATSFPLNRFEIIYADIEPEGEAASLYQSSGDGSGETPLASGDEGGFDNLAYDASGGRIAFTRPVMSGGTEQPQIFIAPLADPENAEQLTEMEGGTQVSRLSWSPDGETIVFSANFTGNDEIWLVNVSDGGLRQLTESLDASDVEPSFSPDGRQIVFASDLGSPGFSQIYVMSVDQVDMTRLTDEPISKSPVWSPDGTRIAYISNQQGDDDLYVMDGNGQRSFLVTLDDDSAVDSFPVWSPDGRWLYFASNRDGNTGWYVTDLQGNVESVTVPGRTPQSLSFVTD